MSKAIDKRRKEMKEKILTPEFRVSYPAIFEPKSFNNGPEKYSVVMLFPKGTNLDALKDLARKAVEERWPDKAKRPKNLKQPFRDGDMETGSNGEPKHAGMIFATATSKLRVGLVDQKCQDIINQDDFYAGCWARAEITAYAYDTAGNRGVAFGLQNLQKTKDDEAFTGRRTAAEVFSPVDVVDTVGEVEVQGDDDDMFGGM